MSGTRLPTPPPVPKPLASATTQRWVWLLLVCWLGYSFTTMGWYLMNDPAFLGTICSER